MSKATEDVYATLLLNDLYLPGALVLGHSLRDAGTKKKLAVLVSDDSVSADAITELKLVYDYVIPVKRIANQSPANLSLMDRVDLHSTFTKIVLWKQLQFRRIVYMDADMVALRAPDELFDLEAPFSAAPDIGWPDLFNTGLLVLKPNMGDYWALYAMAQRGISFDGADQGLLNMHFRNSYNRISFTYNVTPSAHYQYIPAYKHFQSSISATHFIGKEKPWTQGRDASTGSGPFNELAGRWWEVYDGHYRDTPRPNVQRYVKGEEYTQTPEYSTEGSFGRSMPADAPLTEVMHPEVDIEAFKPEPAADPADVPSNSQSLRPTKPEFSAPFAEWDPTRHAPPAGAKPEASNFPSHQYTMSRDVTPFKAPERYPDPPKDMYYEVPKTPTHQKPATIFPWEKNVSKPTRVFAEDRVQSPPKTEAPEPQPTASEEEVTSPNFSNNTRNAWDDIPEIEQYISALRARRGNIQVLRGLGAADMEVSSPTGSRKPGWRLTDFPTEFERPSLPVTPAPIRRPSFWGEERDEAGELPAAEGVPSQEEWDPVKQLEALNKRQSLLLEKGLDADNAKELPSRPMPFGSEGLGPSNVEAATSPQILEISPEGTIKDVKEKKAAADNGEYEDGGIEKPSFTGPGAAWEKDEEVVSPHAPLGPSEEEQDALN